jgi:hypothetical protein
VAALTQTISVLTVFVALSSIRSPRQADPSAASIRRHMPDQQPSSLNQRRTQKDQQAELQQATRQLMESLVRTFQAQQALDRQEKPDD